MLAVEKPYFYKQRVYMSHRQKKYIGKKSKKIDQSQEISAQIILDLLNAGHKPMRMDQILRILGVARKQKKTVEGILFQLAEQGKIFRMHGGQWVSSSQMRILTGKYSVQRSGVGYVDMPPSIDDKIQKLKVSSVFIHPSQAGDAWHGDTVQVALLPGRRGKRDGDKPEGRIVQVIERQAKELTVRMLHKEKGEKHSANFILCKPADPRYPILLRLDSSKLKTIPKRGELLRVKPLEQLASDLWTAEALACIGHEEDIAVQENLVKLNHEAPAEFPPSVYHEIQNLSQTPQESDLQGREDLSHIHFVTIDGETAKDFDDAIHVEKLNNGWCLRVGIADVTHYVRPRTSLDKEAQTRGNSWYFPRSVQPMLPEILSNGLCSLKPHEIRLVMLAELHFDESGNVQKSRFAKGYIRSAARLTYTEVKALVLDNDEQARQNFLQEENAKQVLPMLIQAESLARVLARCRVDRGGLDFHMPEPEYEFDEDGRVTHIIKKQTHFAHQIIEEFMIAANEAVARFLTKKNAPFLYRIHPEPDANHLDGLFRTLKTTPIAENIPKKPTAKNLQGILHVAKNSPQEFLVSRLTLRTMSQARYYPENIGHFGLASDNYCHFTSPIRRYADVVVHRALKFALGLDDVAIPSAQKLVILGDKLNRCERAAIEAEREMAKRLAVLLLQNRIGEGFEGIICGVSDFGIFVEFNEMPVEGMIRIRDLGDDFFEYDPERQELTGVMHGKCYKLGQTIGTRLIDVNLGRLEITLGLVRGKKSTANKPLIKKRGKFQK